MKDSYYNRTYPRIDPLAKERLSAGEQHKPEKPETLVQRLSRRIHNQRVQIARMEQFQWGTNHLATIKRYCWHKQRWDKDITEALATLRAQSARIAALEELLGDQLAMSVTRTWLNEKNRICLEIIPGREFYDTKALGKGSE